MTDRLLQPDQPLARVITLTRTDRWSSILRQRWPVQQRIVALDWSDLVGEARLWPGSVAIVEVDAANFEAACRYAVEWRRQVNGCPLLAVTDLASPDMAGALAAAGVLGTFDSPLAASRLCRLVAKYFQSVEPTQTEVEASFGQRLPWKPLDRYPGNSFHPTRFSAPSKKIDF